MADEQYQNGRYQMQADIRSITLTVARARGAMQLQDDDNTPLNHLEGFVPAIADCHARLCLLQVYTYILPRVHNIYYGLLILHELYFQVIWKRLYNTKPASERSNCKT